MTSPQMRKCQRKLTPRKLNCVLVTRKAFYSTEYVASENLILHHSLFLSVGRTDLMALHCSPDLFARRFYVLVLFFVFFLSAAG